MSDQEKTTPPPGVRLNAEDKFRLMVEASRLSGEELGAFLRSHGLTTQQLDAWREAATRGLGPSTPPRGKRPPSATEAKRVKELERELARKDKALAEFSALLILKKKLDRMWADGDDDTDEGSEK